MEGAGATDSFATGFGVAGFRAGAAFCARGAGAFGGATGFALAAASFRGSIPGFTDTLTGAFGAPAAGAITGVGTFGGTAT